MERNQQIKEYLASLFGQEPPELLRVRESSEKKLLPDIAINSHVAKILFLLSTVKKPKRILEIGTLGAYSTLWLAKTLEEEGVLITLEKNPERARIAREHISEAGFQERVIVLEGDALSLLDELEGPFDLVFIDGDKSQYMEYFKKALPLCSKGALILTDNLIPKRGEIKNPAATDHEAVAIYAFNAWLSTHPKVESAVIPTLVGGSGRIDALGVSVVK